MAIAHQDLEALNLIADQTTTRSFKRTINAAVLLRAARDRPARPRKVQYVAAFLGIAGLFVCQHEQALWVLIHHF